MCVIVLVLLLSGCFRLGTGIKSKNNTIDGSPFKTVSALDCQKKCQEYLECKLFNWNQKSTNCVPRTDLPNGKDSFTNVQEAIVGARNCSSIEIVWPEIYPPSTTTISTTKITTALTTINTTTTTITTTTSSTIVTATAGNFSGIDKEAEG